MPTMRTPEHGQRVCGSVWVSVCVLWICVLRSSWLPTNDTGWSRGSRHNSRPLYGGNIGGVGGGGDGYGDGGRLLHKIIQEHANIANGQNGLSVCRSYMPGCSSTIHERHDNDTHSRDATTGFVVHSDALMLSATLPPGPPAFKMCV